MHNIFLSCLSDSHSKDGYYGFVAGTHDRPLSSARAQDLETCTA